MRFESPIAFLALLLLPAVVWIAMRRGRRASVGFSSFDALLGVGGSVRSQMAWTPLLLRLIVIAMLAVALARPREGVSETRITTQGIAIAMVVDRSGSMDDPMESEGRAMPRFDVVKRVFRDFVVGDGARLEGRPDDLIGLIAFARFPETICPLVRGHDALVELVDQMGTATLRIENRTAIGDAIVLGAARLQKAEEDLASRAESNQPKDFTIKSKVMILLTDGEDNASAVPPLTAAKQAA
ncbi:MAG: VWA domain-containing protein, partial [Planctomycetota bacterium]|nr:VWA domain-containing protein [Planctomycetota bacterium]